MSNFHQDIFIGEKIQLGYFFKRAGENIIILFPGFGQSARHYVYFANQLHASFSILAIDHFYHGDSKAIDENTAIDQEDLNATISDLLDFLGFKHPICILGGFSFGNWMAAACLHSEQLKPKAWLVMSPPSYRFSGLFRFATRNRLGKLVFRFYAVHFSQLMRVLLLLQKLGLVSSHKIKMATKQVEDSSKSQRLYRNWKLMRQFVPHWQNCIKLAQNKKMKVLFTNGVEDKITPADELKKQFEQVSEFEILDFQGGHTFASDEIIQQINLIILELNKQRKFEQDSLTLKK
ncbi:MAG: alpha/beta hydrolase [Bacteroidia bacterium]